MFCIGVRLKKLQWFCVFVPLTNNGTYAWLFHHCDSTTYSIQLSFWIVIFLRLLSTFSTSVPLCSCSIILLSWLLISVSNATPTSYISHHYIPVAMFSENIILFVRCLSTNSSLRSMYSHSWMALALINKGSLKHFKSIFSEMNEWFFLSLWRCLSFQSIFSYLNCNISETDGHILRMYGPLPLHTFTIVCEVQHLFKIRPLQFVLSCNISNLWFHLLGDHSLLNWLTITFYQTFCFHCFIFKWRMP